MKICLAYLWGWEGLERAIRFVMVDRRCVGGC